MTCIVQVQMSIAVYLRNYIRAVIGRMGGDELTPAFLTGLMEIFYRSIVSAVIPIPIKRHLYLVFENLIVVYQT